MQAVLSGTDKSRRHKKKRRMPSTPSTTRRRSVSDPQLNESRTGSHESGSPFFCLPHDAICKARLLLDLEFHTMLLQRFESARTSFERNDHAAGCIAVRSLRYCFVDRHKEWMRVVHGGERHGLCAH